MRMMRMMRMRNTDPSTFALGSPENDSFRSVDSLDLGALAGFPGLLAFVLAGCSLASLLGFLR